MFSNEFIIFLYKRDNIGVIITVTSNKKNHTPIYFDILFSLINEVISLILFFISLPTYTIWLDYYKICNIQLAASLILYVSRPL